MNAVDVSIIFIKVIMGLLVAIVFFALASSVAVDTGSRFSKHYRILQKGNWYYVQHRVWWWPFWNNYSHYTVYDLPKDVIKYGGFFGNIGYPDINYGYNTELASDLSEAEGWLKTLKLDHIVATKISKERRKKKSIRKVYSR